MDTNWRKWVDENIARGCNPVEIRDILLKNQFSLTVIKKAMGNHFPQEDMLDILSIDYEKLANIKITQTAKKIETELLQLYTLENFLNDKECDDLIDLINTRLRPSTISTTEEMDKYFRTSSTCDLSYLEHKLIEDIDQKIATAMGINISYSEGIQAQRYEIGQQFKAHTDYFEPDTEEYQQYASVQGNRTWTFMVYLNNTIQGGGTLFVNLNQTLYPKKGMAVIWNNLYADGTPNPNTLHWGLPVEQGVKIIITKWFREKGSGEMLTI